MAPASATAVPAVLDRPLVDRPEPKLPDGAEGQFAGLMAQFALPPARPEATEPVQPDSQDQEKSTVSEPVVPQASNGPNGTNGTTPVEAQAAQGVAATAASDPMTAAKLAPASTPITASATTPVPTPAATFMPIPQGDPVSPPTTPANPSAPSPAGSIQVPQEPLAAAPGAVPQPVSSVQVKVEAAPVAPPVTVPAPPAGDPASPPLNEAAFMPSSVPSDGEAPPPPPSVFIQAVLAEPGTKTQASPKTDPVDLQRQPVQPAPLVSAIPPDTKLPALPLPPLEMTSAHPRLQAKTPLPVAGEPVSVESPSGSGQGSTQPTSNLDARLPLPEAAAPAALSVPQGHPLLPQEGSMLGAITTLRQAPAILPTAIPEATPHATVPLPTPPVVQVEGGLRWMLKGGAQEAHLQLHPESLGQVTIHLKVEGGEVHARLWITESASVQTIQEGRPHLELSLKEQGLQLGSFDLQQGQRPFQEAPSTSAFSERPTLDATPARQEAPSVPVASILNAHHVELYA